MYAVLILFLSFPLQISYINFGNVEFANLVNVARKRDYSTPVVKSDVIIRRDTLYRMSDVRRSVYYWLTGVVVQTDVCSGSVCIRGPCNYTDPFGVNSR